MWSAHGLFGFASVGEHYVRGAEALEGVTDALHFLLQELQAAYSEYSEEETNDHNFLFFPFVMGREIV